MKRRNVLIIIILIIASSIGSLIYIFEISQNRHAQKDFIDLYKEIAFDYIKNNSYNIDSNGEEVELRFKEFRGSYSKNKSDKPIGSFEEFTEKVEKMEFWFVENVSFKPTRQLCCIVVLGKNECGEIEVVDCYHATIYGTRLSN